MKVWTLTVAAIGAAAVALPAVVVASNQAALATSLKPANAFASIQNKDARSVALFQEMGKVLTHPRCVNCHPKADSPLQGDAMTPHSPPVTRGAGGMGAPGMQCTTCHGPTNVTFTNGTGSIPGHARWSLAPIEMAWEGKSLRQICEQLKDPERNGGKTLGELQEHNAHDELVGWGWNPGFGRTPAPGTQAQFGDLTKAWIDSGAKCPS